MVEDRALLIAFQGIVVCVRVRVSVFASSHVHASACVIKGRMRSMSD